MKNIPLSRSTVTPRCTAESLLIDAPGRYEAAESAITYARRPHGESGFKLKTRSLIPSRFASAPAGRARGGRGEKLRKYGKYQKCGKLSQNAIFD